MFRRRTDRVYSTLQNVQRRITQGTVHDGHTPQTPSVSSVSPVAGSAAPTDSRGGTVFEVPKSDPDAPLIQPVASAYAEAPVVGDSGLVGAPQVVEPQPTIQAVPSPSAAPLFDDTAADDDELLASSSPASHAPSPPRAMPVAPEPAPDAPSAPSDSAAVANPALQLARQEGRGTRLMLSTEVALLLTVGWLLTCALFFAIGWQLGEGASSDAPFAGLGPHAESGQHESDQIEPGQSHILILQSGRGAVSDATRERFEAEAARMNGIAAERAGLEPWFGVRYPQSGGIQLIFGQVDGRFGIDQTSSVASAVFATMQNSQSYADAYWFDLAPSR